MGYEIVLGTCWSCQRPFTFNPDLVPSIPVDPVKNLPPDLGGDVSRAVKQPICEHCVNRANLARRQNGMPEIEILPGAYEAVEV